MTYSTALLRSNNYYYCRVLHTCRTRNIYVHCYIYSYVAFPLIHATKSENRQHSAWPLQIDSGAETGLVNLDRRFRDRMLLMIGNFSIRYVREQVSTFSCMCVCVYMCTIITDLNGFIYFERKTHCSYSYCKQLNKNFLSKNPRISRFFINLNYVNFFGTIKIQNFKAQEKEGWNYCINIFYIFILS